MPLPGNRVSWAVIHNVPKASAKDGEARFSEWGPEATEEMINFVRHQPSPLKCTLGEVIDRTPKHLISKIMLEEKYFESWYNGRVVLLGDGILLLCGFLICLLLFLVCVVRVRRVANSVLILLCLVQFLSMPQGKTSNYLSATPFIVPYSSNCAPNHTHHSLSL